MCAIIDAAPLRDGHSQELCRLHNIVRQHLHELKAMGYDPSQPFITTLLELKLDQSTMFAWLRHSQESRNTPHYQELVDFLDLRAQASKIPPKANLGGKTDTYVANVSKNCLACRARKHPLFSCNSFRMMAPERKIALLKESG